METPPLHKAVLESDLEQTSTLINLNVDLNELDELGQSALHWAVFRGDLETVEILLNAGADPNVIASDGVSPRWRANDFGLIEIEQLLERFEGKILTSEDFDRKSFSVFSSILAKDLPKEENTAKKKNKHHITWVLQKWRAKWFM